MIEHKRDVVILLDSITRLARAYNTVQPHSGKILSAIAEILVAAKQIGVAIQTRKGGVDLTGRLNVIPDEPPFAYQIARAQDLIHGGRKHQVLVVFESVDVVIRSLEYGIDPVFEIFRQTRNKVR